MLNLNENEILETERSFKEMSLAIQIYIVVAQHIFTKL